LIKDLFLGDNHKPTEETDRSSPFSGFCHQSPWRTFCSVFLVCLWEMCQTLSKFPYRGSRFTSVVLSKEKHWRFLGRLCWTRRPFLPVSREVSFPAGNHRSRNC